tara:strand:+ start:431 stop:940 length:510 start_codon:yes stop_codon:yes gene_type:complete
MAAYRSRFGDRRNRTETLGMTVSRLTKPIFGNRGLADGTVAKEWCQIVGPMIAKHSRPDRISYANRERHSGLLHLRVDHSAMATELQHLEPQLLERINGYFGFKAVAKMRFIHGPLKDTPSAEASASPRPEPPQNPAVAQEVTTVEDPELREALTRLGNAVYYHDTQSE